MKIFHAFCDQSVIDRQEINCQPKIFDQQIDKICVNDILHNFVLRLLNFSSSISKDQPNESNENDLNGKA